jgi:SNF2 family DNA or RNA helicase
MSLKLKLFPYQEDAFSMFSDRGSELLAFDTGLGKTATAIAIAEDLLETRKVRRVLIVAPASLKYQWAEALAKFTDMPTREIKFKKDRLTVPVFESCAIIDGTPEQRARQYIRAKDAEYIIVGYDQVVSDWNDIEGFGCGFAILDEASMIKSFVTDRTRAVKEYLDMPYRLALTATPIENKPEEVFSIMQWVDPDVLGRWDFFDKSYIIRDSYGAVRGYRNLDVLNERLSVAMCRKTRDDPEVSPYLPKVDTHVWSVPMSSTTEHVYRRMCADLMAAYDAMPRGSGRKISAASNYGFKGPDNRGDKTALGKIAGVHTCMEMLLDDASLIRQSAWNYENTKSTGSAYASKVIKKGWYLPEISVKARVVLAKVDKILRDDPDAKILIFTRYRGMVDIFVRDFEDLGYASVEYHGGMSPREKQASVTRFKTEKDTRLFVSSHAGAYGTDLPMANWLINYDIPWGAGLGRQINGRHVRASSEFKLVHVVYVVTEGTIEERKYDVRTFKNAISEAAIDGTSETGYLKSDVKALRAHASSYLDKDDPDG